MRQKTATLEDRLVETDSRRQETEEEFAKNRRLVKLLEKYKCELNDANTEIQDLKNKVSDCKELQVSCSLTSVVVHGQASSCLKTFEHFVRTDSDCRRINIGTVELL